MTRAWSALVEVVASLCPSLAAAQGRSYEWGWGMHPMGGTPRMGVSAILEILSNTGHRILILNPLGETEEALDLSREV
jgi:hypothetical protein